MLGTFNEDLSKLTRAIRRGDGEALFEHFPIAPPAPIRRGIVEIGQDFRGAGLRPGRMAQLGKKKAGSSKRVPPGRSCSVSSTVHCRAGAPACCWSKLGPGSAKQR